MSDDIRPADGVTWCGILFLLLLELLNATSIRSLKSADDKEMNSLRDRANRERDTSSEWFNRYYEAAERERQLLLRQKAVAK